MLEYLKSWDRHMPVYSNLESDYTEVGLGGRIRALRKARGWTLQDLSSKLSLSIASLSTLENDKASVDVERLVAICNALDVQPEDLLPKGASSHFHIERREALLTAGPATLRVVDHGRGGQTPYHNLLHPLADPFVGKHIEPFQIEIRPVRDEDLRFISHHHEEFFVVLRGEVECLLKTPDGTVREILGAGDCISFWSFLPHCLRSTTNEPAGSVHVMCSAHGSADSERADGPSADIVYFRDMSTRPLTQQIAEKLTAMRRARGMSLADFACEVGIGARQLAEVERGRKPVSVRFLLKLCRTFRKPLEHFLAGATAVARPYYSVIRADEIARLPQRTRRQAVPEREADHEFRSLAGDFAGRGMHPYYVRTSPRHGGTATLHEHHGQEFVFVLSGSVELRTIQDGRHVSRELTAGDACFIDSAVPHRFVGTGFGRSELIDVFWSGLGEDYLFARPDDQRPTDLATTGA